MQPPSVLSIACRRIVEEAGEPTNSCVLLACSYMVANARGLTPDQAAAALDSCRYGQDEGADALFGKPLAQVFAEQITPAPPFGEQPHTPDAEEAQPDFFLCTAAAKARAIRNAVVAAARALGEEDDGC